jgi:hypothetical protein
MVTEIYCAEGLVDNYYNHDVEAVIVEWKNLTTNTHFRNSCEAQITALEKYEAGILIIDTSHAVGMPYPEDQKWLIDVLYPRIRKLNFHLIINVLPLNQIAKIGVNTWMSSGNENNIQFIEVATIKEAYEIAYKIPSVQKIK